MKNIALIKKVIVFFIIDIVITIGIVGFVSINKVSQENDNENTRNIWGNMQVIQKIDLKNTYNINIYARANYAKVDDGVGVLCKIVQGNKVVKKFFELGNMPNGEWGNLVILDPKLLEIQGEAKLYLKSKNMDEENYIQLQIVPCNEQNFKITEALIDGNLKNNEAIGLKYNYISKLDFIKCFFVIYIILFIIFGNSKFNSDSIDMSISDRLRPLDALRGFGALIIAFILHWHDNMNHDFSLFHWGIEYGGMLVELFFILSGLTFTAFYMKRIANKEVTISEFMYSRFVRLYPLHIFTLSIITILLLLRGFVGIKPLVYGYNDIHEFILNILLIHADGIQTSANFNAPSWTICIEILMYIIFFIICSKVKSKHMYFIICWIMILLGFSFERSSNSSLFVLINNNIGRGMVAFFFGSILYFILKKLYIYRWEYRFKIISLVLIISILIGGYYTDNVFTGHGSWYSILTSLIFIVFPCIIYLCTENGYLRSILLWKPFQYLGRISFTIYMCHYFVQLVIDTIFRFLKININYNSYFIWILYCISVLIFAALIHKYFEVPVTRFLKEKKNKWWIDERLDQLS